MRIVVALGGNALERAGGDGSWEEATARMRASAHSLAAVVAAGHDLVVTHGNGPQVGALLRSAELAEREVPPRPLYVLGAETQGQIGSLIQQELTIALARAREPRVVLPIVSRVVVNGRDPAFRRPKKPVGRFYSETEARLLKKREGWSLTYDGPRGGWRRVVASPSPIEWLEAAAVERLLGDGGGRRWVPVVAGGGGIAVVATRSGSYEPRDAVVDKDATAALVGRDLRAHTLVIVTDVPGAAVGYGQRWERWLGEVTREELVELERMGEFADGSMGPKIKAGLSFLASGGDRFIVTDIPSLPRALRGEAGTRVTRD